MNEEMKGRVETIIQTTYEIIGSDFCVCDLECAVECTLDANRIEQYGNDVIATNVFLSMPWKQRLKVAREALKVYF